MISFQTPTGCHCKQREHRLGSLISIGCGVGAAIFFLLIGNLQAEAFSSPSLVHRCRDAHAKNQVHRRTGSATYHLNLSFKPSYFVNSTDTKSMPLEPHHSDPIEFYTKETMNDDDSFISDLPVQDAANDMVGDEYKRGIAIIAFITLLNASLAPIWHFVFEGSVTPPPLFLNAVVSVVALIGLLVGGPFLDNSVSTMSSLAIKGQTKAWNPKSFRGGIELGLWKGLGTTCHIYGMAMTTANHGAFLLQMTTLIVPVVQGIRGERIPGQIQLAVALALAGIVTFTQDPTGATNGLPTSANPSMVHVGDALVLAAAVFYSIYDIQTYYWGKEIPRTELVTIKIGFQALLSVVLCAVAARTEVMEYVTCITPENLIVFVPTVLWSGLFVNAFATFLQVGGMQAVGPTRAQTIFASQPLWAAILNFVFLGSIMGMQGYVGGAAFLAALYMAATAEAPKTVIAVALKEDTALELMVDTISVQANSTLAMRKVD